MSIFAASKQNLYHLSVGVVLINNDGFIGVHHFAEPRENYILIRETIEAGESIEQTAQRGMQEEFGATGKIVGYLGSRVSSYKVDSFDAQKTVVYVVAQLADWRPETRAQDDREAGSQIEWHAATDLTEKIRQTHLNADTDESEIVERLLRSPWAHLLS